MKRRVGGFDGYLMGDDDVADGGRGGVSADALVPSREENAQRWGMERGHGLGQQDPYQFPFPAWQPAPGSSQLLASSGSTGSYFTSIFPGPANEMKPLGSDSWCTWHLSPYDDHVDHHQVCPHLKMNDFCHSAQLETPVHSAANYSCSETAHQQDLRSLQLLPTNPLFPASSGDTSMNFFKEKEVEKIVGQEMTTEFGELELVLHKDLSNSDVGNIGRIVLPKREAETHLPPLFERDGMFLHMDDLTLPVAWRFKYRYWPNNKTRMYILENTGSFVKTHGLQAGDSFLIYRTTSSGNYVACGKKINSPWIPMLPLHSDQHNTCNNNEDRDNVQDKKRNKLSEVSLM